jgi:putative transposase
VINKGFTVKSVCEKMGRSRQSYYKSLRSQSRKLIENDILLELVRPVRAMMPRIGGRKLLHLLADTMANNALKIGRDRFFRWLKDHDLLIYPKRMYVHTTQSFHRFRIYENMAATMALSKPNQLWVSDITYIRTQEGFCYLALITDAFSRKIVGFDLSDSLELEGCLRALKQALQTASPLNQLVHHSDRGFQYCSNPYTDLLKQSGIKISMAAKGNCYENALAERVNGILKNEFHLDYTFKNKHEAKQTAINAIYIYNQHRPHWAIELDTPNKRHAA